MTSSLVGNAYVVMGQASVSLHTIVVQQVYQADLLKDVELDPGMKLWTESWILLDMPLRK